VHLRVNRQVRLKSRPAGVPEAEHFEIVEAPVPDLSDGRVLVRNIYLSVDPGRLLSSMKKSTYTRPSQSVSTVKKPHAIIELAWARRNPRQLSWTRAPAGDRSACRRILATVVAETR
jgi:hypothetical protein